MKILAIILAVVCVLEACVIVYLSIDHTSAGRFQPLTSTYGVGAVAFDTKSGRTCWSGAIEESAFTPEGPALQLTTHGLPHSARI